MKRLLLSSFVLHIAVATAKFVAGGRMVEFSSTHHEVYGKYISRDGIHGITFFSRADDYLLIRTFSGKNIVEASPTTEIDGRKFRSVYIMGHECLQHVSSHHSDQPVDHNTPLSDAMRDLINMEEAGLLEEAAEAIGKRGINGKDTPAAMPFFIFALRVTQFQTEGDNGVFISNTTSRVERDDCSNTCPPCPNNNCFGMCGKGCSCWDWVCGDCCWHVGCYYHDKCCAESFFQARCLFPVDFRCNQQYSC